MVSRLLPAGLSILALVASGCGLTSVDEVAPRHGPWVSEIAWEAGVKIGGCALGDIDPATPGDEVVVVTGDHRVVLLRRSEDGWEDELVAQFDGEMIQVAVAELSSNYPGEEILCVGAKKGSEDDPGPGVAMLCYQSGGQFVTKTLFEDAALVHGVSVDEDGRIALVGYTGKARLFEVEDELEQLPDSGLGMIEFGNELGQGKAVLGLGASSALVASADGALVRIDGLTAETWWKSPDSLARLGRAGDLVVCCDNGGRLQLFSVSGAFEPRQLHDAADRLRGAVLADLSADHDGVEAATADYDGRLIVFDTLEEDASYIVVATDNDRFHHLATGVVEGLGRSLVAVGYGGRVHVAYRLESD